MHIKDLITRVNQLIEQGKKVLETRSGSKKWGENVDFGRIKGFRSASLSFIERVYGIKHSHYNEFSGSVDGSSAIDVESGISILESIKEELEGDWLFSIKGLITSEVFANFIEMAKYLLDQGYKDPAAVIAGSVLEEHLRQLCIANNIDIEFVSGGVRKPKKADTLNSDLVKGNIFSKLDQKSVTMWLDLRNNAAHGHYNEYTKEQVQNMIQGITEFMSRIHI